MIWLIIDIVFLLVCLLLLVRARRFVGNDAIYKYGDIDIVIDIYTERCKHMKLLSRVALLMFSVIGIYEHNLRIPIPALISFILSCWFLRYVPKMIVGKEAANPRYVAKGVAGTAGDVAGEVIRVTPGGGVKAAVINGVARYVVRNGVNDITSNIDTKCRSLHFQQLIELAECFRIVTNGKSREQLLSEILYIVPHSIQCQYAECDDETQAYYIYNLVFNNRR